MIKAITTGAFLALALVFNAAQADAATLDFEDVTASDTFGGGLFQISTDHPSNNPSIVNGNCASGSCLSVRANNQGGGETVTISRVGGGTFTVNSFWFQLLGNALNNTLRVTSPLIDYAQTDFPNNNGGQTVSVAGLFDNVTSISFQNINRGGLRIDDLNVTVPDIAPVPLPAAGWMLFAAIGGMAFWRRRATA